MVSLSSYALAPQDISSDVTAVCDALECLAAVVSANAAARATLLEAGALAACAQLLPQGVVSGNTGSKAKPDSKPSAATMHMRLLAVRLLTLLLEGDVDHRENLVEGEPIMVYLMITSYIFFDCAHHTVWSSL